MHTLLTGSFSQPAPSISLQVSFRMTCMFPGNDPLPLDCQVNRKKILVVFMCNICCYQRQCFIINRENNFSKFVDRGETEKQNDFFFNWVVEEWEKALLFFFTLKSFQAQSLVSSLSVSTWQSVAGLTSKPRWECSQPWYRCERAPSTYDEDLSVIKK